MYSPAVARVLAENPRRLTSNDFLVNLAASLNVGSIPLAILLLILIIVASILLAFLAILIVRHCLRKRSVPVRKKKVMKSIYLDEICKEALPEYGTLGYTIEYMLKKETMKVTVVQASQLNNGQSDVNTCDPYVTVTPMVNDDDSLTQSGTSKKTEIKWKSAKPTWHTSFYFKVSQLDLLKFALKFEVFDYDSTGPDISLGWFMVDLKEFDVTEYTNTVLEKTVVLQPGTPKMTGLGEVCIGLSYLPSQQRLNVTIFEARQLNLDSENEQSKWKGIVFRVNAKVDKHNVGSHTTRWKRDMVNPYFNEYMTFHIRSEQLQDACLVISLRGVSGLLRLQTTVGAFELGNASCFTTGIKHWEKMLKCQSRMHVMWHVIEKKFK